MLETNTLDSVIASVFLEATGRRIVPFVYYLKTIIDAKLNYPIHNKEMLAIISSF